MRYYESAGTQARQSATHPVTQRWCYSRSQHWSARHSFNGDSWAWSQKMHKSWDWLCQHYYLAW